MSLNDFVLILSFMYLLLIFLWRFFVGFGNSFSKDPFVCRKLCIFSFDNTELQYGRPIAVLWSNNLFENLLLFQVSVSYYRKLSFSNQFFLVKYFDDCICNAFGHLYHKNLLKPSGRTFHCVFGLLSLHDLLPNGQSHPAIHRPYYVRPLGDIDGLKPKRQHLMRLFVKL